MVNLALGQKAHENHCDSSMRYSRCLLGSRRGNQSGDGRSTTTLKEYYRAEEISKQLEARHNAVFKELAELRLEGDRLLKEAHDLQERSLDLALSETARTDTKRSFGLKLADFRAFEVSYDQTRGQREAEFQNQAVAANKRILDEILTRTRSIGEAGGFNLVFNASKLNPAGSDVVFFKDIDDITEKV